MTERVHENAKFDLESLDVLIINGVEINGTVLDLSAEQWELQLAVNLRSVFSAWPIFNGS